MNSVRTLRIDVCNVCGGRDSNPVAESIDFEYKTCDNSFFFVSCGSCGHVYLRNRPDPSELNVIYPPEYIPHHFDEHLGPFITRLRNSVQRKKVRPLARHLKPGAVIVDVGPGNGEFLSLLKEFGSPDWDLWGIDFSKDAIEIIERRGFKGLCDRFETAEWKGPAPNAIVMNQLIEHLEDPTAAVEKAYDMLAPNGVLFIETPSVDAWDYKLFKKRYWGGWHTPRHWHLFRAETLTQLVQDRGFTIIEVRHILSPNFWLQSLHHQFDERWNAPKLAKFCDVNVLVSLAAASAVDVMQLGLRRKTSNFRLIARKPARS